MTVRGRIARRLPALPALLVGLAGFAAAGSAPADAPGVVEPRGEALQRRLRAAVAEHGPSYRPRTRHLREDGGPSFTNRLALEASPYLQQHAHNPVDWYPWGDEALAVARRLGRPIFLSIGYSTCHWCHVMEEESFEDLEIASVLNAGFVPIKVDREERPDLDAVYMAAVQTMTGRGGWPMSTWLTPDGEPFHGGTYFPARDGDRGRATGFLTLLRRVREAWDEQPDQLRATAAKLSAAVRQRLGSPGPAATAASVVALDAAAVLARAADGYRRRYDERHGGVRGAPKFPSSFPVRTLLREAERTADEGLRTMALATLDAMAAGGIHDQIGGGFHRYATDAAWLVPHFEKMLYDNARLGLAYVEAFQLTAEPRFATVAGRVFDYVRREMTAPGGGFYAATDADSAGPDGEREEGLFFTWTPAELRAALGDPAAARIAAYYGVTEAGNFEGRSILHRPRSIEQVAAAVEMRPASLRREVERARTRLYEVRSKRPAPLRDDKVLAAWNGLMIESMARAGFALDRPELHAAAARAAGFVLERLVVDGTLHRGITGDRLGPPGFLDDHAFMIAGLLALFETGGDPAHLEAAVALQAQLDARFADPRGGYFMTATDHESLLAREKPSYDGAEPSGNSIAVVNLLRLEALTGRDEYRRTAQRALAAFAATLARQPGALSEMLVALQWQLGSPRQVVLVAGERGDAGAMLDALRERTGAREVVVPIASGAELERLVRAAPIVRGKLARGGRTTAYVCLDGVCRLPTVDVGELRRQLEETAPTPEESTATPAGS